MRILTILVLCALSAFWSAPTHARAVRAQCGEASWYAMAGKRTASGEKANPNGFTAAHRSLPFGTKVRVTNRRNGRSVVVRINDRGPFVRGRIIDLSRAAAAQIGLVRAGRGPVRVSSTGDKGRGC